MRSGNNRGCQSALVGLTRLGKATTLLLVGAATLLPVWQESAAAPAAGCGPCGQGITSRSVGISPVQWTCREPAMKQSSQTCKTPELDAEPELKAPTTLLLTPAACGSLAAPTSPPGEPEPLPWVTPSFWQQCIKAHEQVTDFLVSPGDYSNWGRLLVYERDGRPERKRVIRYWGPGREAHPVNRLESGPAYEATITGFSFADARHWILYGLTIRHPLPTGQFVGFIGYSGAGAGSAKVIVDSLLMENASGYGMRISKASDSCVQNSVIRNMAVVTFDRPGIQIKPGDNSGAHPTTGNRIVNNEIVNHTDAIALTNGTGEIDGTLIEENDFYFTPDFISRLEDGKIGCTENGIDIKIGSSDPANPVRIENNRVWGSRFLRHCSGTADGVVIHQLTKNLVLRQNVIFDVPVAITIKPFPDASPQTRNVLIEKNLFYGVRGFRGDQPLPRHDAGVLSLQTPVIVRDNVFAHSERLFTADVRDETALASHFERNQLLAVSDLTHAPPLFAKKNKVFTTVPAKAMDYVFPRGRWQCCSAVVLKQAFVP